MKILIAFLFSLLIFLPVSSVLAEEPTDWTQFYGDELLEVPIVLRRQFQLSSGKTWHRVSIEERKGFLDDQEATQKSREQEELDRIQEKEDREKYLEKKAKLKIKAERDREKKRLAKEKAKEKERKDRQKKLDDLKKKREETLKRLKEMQKRRNEN